MASLAAAICLTNPACATAVAVSAPVVGPVAIGIAGACGAVGLIGVAYGWYKNRNK